MKKPQSPCSRNCKERNAFCHTLCQKYLDFAKANEDFRNEVNKMKNEEQKLRSRNYRRK